VKDFMAKMPIRKIPGIGNVSEQILLGLGIENCG
jgi:nucleotidyltransferase/DNA polymerase involved in DNA repair